MLCWLFCLPGISCPTLDCYLQPLWRAVLFAELLSVCLHPAPHTRGPHIPHSSGIPVCRELSEACLTSQQDLLAPHSRTILTLYIRIMKLVTSHIGSSVVKWIVQGRPLVVEKSRIRVTCPEPPSKLCSLYCGDWCSRLAGQAKNNLPEIARWFRIYFFGG